MARTRTASVHVPTDMEDRCPCARPFSESYSGCPAYQRATFTAADSLNRPLGSFLTCRHLTFGRNTSETGGFYPRCALGSRDSRLRWLAEIRPERLDAVQAISEEFDEFSAGYRQQLFATKLRAVAAPGDMAIRQELSAVVAGYVAAVRDFLESRRERLAEVGLPATELTSLIEEWLVAWTATRDMATLAPDADRLAAMGGPVQAFLGGDAWRRSVVTHPGAVGAASILQDDGVLRISRGPGGRLELAGDVDSSTVPALAGVLAAAMRRGRDIEVDMTGVLFCDLGGVRELLRSAAAMPPGRRLVIKGIPDHLLKVMRLAGWGEMPALAVVEQWETSAGVVPASGAFLQAPA